jgi:ribonuclease HI
MLFNITIFTDGGCYPNPGPGGWGAVLIDLDRKARKELSGNDPQTTNQRMELTAAIKALRALVVPCYVDLYSDSQYLIKGMSEWLPNWIRTGQWQQHKRPTANRDLWEELVAEANRHTVTWEWVRGHSGHRENERADALATKARLSL